MIVTSMRPYGLMKSVLRKRNKIGIISCNFCVEACETGGRKKMDELATRLEDDGYNVVQKEIIPMVCNLRSENKPQIIADKILILACKTGIVAFQMHYPLKDIIPVLDTIGLGARDNLGNIILIQKI